MIEDVCRYEGGSKSERPFFMTTDRLYNSYVVVARLMIDDWNGQTVMRKLFVYADETRLYQWKQA